MHLNNSTLSASVISVLVQLDCTLEFNQEIEQTNQLHSPNGGENGIMSKPVRYHFLPEVVEPPLDVNQWHKILA